MLALYAELDDKAEHLSRANELKARFLSNMSHEIRTPLNSILALSQLLLDRVDGELTEEQEKQVTFIHKGTEDLSSLVNDLLDVAKIEAGKTVVHPRECSVTEIFSGLRGMLKPLLANESLNLVFEEPERIPFLYTDDGKVSQILRNFLSNALKCSERGEIRVSARRSEDAGAVVFSVADTGIGIALEDQKRIFEEYSQLDRCEIRQVKGTGLGLSISRKLTEMLGGSAEVESVPGVGSTFYAIIPIRYQDSDTAPASRAEVEVDATRLPVLVIEDHPETQLLYERTISRSAPLEKALIIDDEEVARYILRGLLADTKYGIVEAGNGPDGLRLAETERPDVIFLDLMMPDMTGFQVIEKLKKNPMTRDIPVIIVTGKVLDDEERRILEVQALAILSKEGSSRESTVMKVRDALRKAAEFSKGKEMSPNG